MMPMIATVEAEINRQTRRTAVVAGTIVAVVGALVIIGWVTGSVMLTHGAVGFLCAGVALILLSRPATSATTAGGVFFAVVATMVGTVTVAQDFFALDLGIDEFFVSDTHPAQTFAPGRMSPIGASIFIIIGIAMLLIASGTEPNIRWGQRIAVVPMMGSVLAIVGYIYGVEELYRPSPHAVVTPHGAVTSLAMCVGTLALRSDVGMVRLFVAPDIAGLIWRRLLPLAIAIPILLGGARELAVSQFPISDQVATAVMVLGMSAVYVGLIAWTAQSVLRAEAARVAALCHAREQREWLQVTLASIGDAVIATDARARITFMNPMAEQLTGHSSATTLGRPVYEIFRPVDERTNQPMSNPVRRVLRTGRMVGLENPALLVRPDETSVPIDDSAAPIRLKPDGPVHGVVLVFRDVTDRRRHERELADSIERYRELAETLERRVDERTAVATAQAEQLRALTIELTQTEQRERRRIAQALHDHLQQILVAAKMRIELLRGQFASDNSELATSMNETVTLLAQAIEESRSLTIQLSPPMLHDHGLLPALGWLIGQVQREHRLTVELTHNEAAERATIDADIREFLFQAVRELLFNVVKHAGVDRADVAVTTSADGDAIEIRVRDDGVGCDEARLLRHHASLNGFGLFSIQQRLDVIGGHMHVITAPGHGCEIRLICPISVATAAEPPAESADRLRVVIADDQALMREGLAQVLSGHSDIEVVGQAATGAEAVELTRRVVPDVVLMDVMMPVMDGVTATKIIKSEFPSVRVVGVSIHDPQEMAATMHEAGACAYYPKSGASADLLNLIRR